MVRAVRFDGVIDFSEVPLPIDTETKAAMSLTAKSKMNFEFDRLF